MLGNSIKLQCEPLLSCGRYEYEDKIALIFFIKGNYSSKHCIAQCLRAAKSKILPCSTVSHKR